MNHWLPLFFLFLAAANRIIAIIEPDGFTNRTAYNNIGKVAYTTNKLGVVTRFDYDARGLLTNTVFALGTSLQTSEQSAYDAEGRRTNSTDRAGRSTTFAYDAVGRLLRTTFPDQTYIRNTYDVGGRLYATAQGPRTEGINPPPPELTTKYQYDAAGRRTAVIHGLAAGYSTGVTNRFAYDANGNQTQLVDALNRTNTYAFDRLNRQTKVTFPDGSSESYGYDALNRRTSLTNQAGIITRFGYDKLGRLTAVTNAFGSATPQWATYAYDEVGNQTNQVDALGRMTKFEYDAIGRRVRTIQPGAQSEGFAYDAAGNQVRHTNFNSVIITNQYDALNRLTNKASAGGYQVRFTYTPTGQRATMVDASGSYTFAYNVRGQLTTNAGPAGTLVYGYDVYGRLASIASTRSGGASVSYTYDSLNRLLTAADAVVGTTTYGYNGVGSLETVRYPNSVTNTYTYDSLNRLTNLTATASSGTLANFAYTLGSAGNRTALSETVNGVGRNFAWQYDPLYRLTNETISGTAPTGTISYKYDAVGNRTNRTSSVTGVANQTFSYNSNDWLTTDVYDNNGSTRTNGADTFQYDVEGRLTSATVGGTSVSYTYNADGIRVSKTTGGVTILYLVDDRNPTGYAQVLEELAVSGGTTNLTKVYTYGQDLIAQRIVSSGQRSFYGYDGNGNTRYLTGTNAAITDTYVYDAFGTLLASTGSTANDYLFTGEQYDGSLGLYYLRARYLNAGTGRFWTRDTHPGNNQEPLSLHRYLYVSADPVNRVDPSGLVEFNLGSFMAAMSKAAGLAANTAWRVAPLANRVTILLYESVSGTTIVGGAGLLVGGKFVMTTVGGGTKVLDPAVKGGLERVALAGFEEAGKYGVWPHRLLAKLVPPNSGLHKHHLVEVRFADKLKVAPGDIPAIALTPAEHAKYTSRWLEKIARRNMEHPVRTDNATVDNIWEAAQEVYEDAPELLEFVQMFMNK